MKKDIDIINELYTQHIEEAAPLAIGAMIGNAAKDTLIAKGVDAVDNMASRAMDGASEDPTLVTAGTDINDTSDELGDKLKGANIEMFSDMIANAIQELIKSSTSSNSPLGASDCVDMIVASANNYLAEGGCNSRH